MFEAIAFNSSYPKPLRKEKFQKTKTQLKPA
jgi:hypothetical protein